MYVRLIGYLFSVLQNYFAFEIKIDVSSTYWFQYPFLFTIFSDHTAKLNFYISMVATLTSVSGFSWVNFWSALALPFLSPYPSPIKHRHICSWNNVDALLCIKLCSSLTARPSAPSHWILWLFMIPLLYSLSNPVLWTCPWLFCSLTAFPDTVFGVLGFEMSLNDIFHLLTSSPLNHSFLCFILSIFCY